MNSYENEQVRPDARLIILKALAAQTDERLHSGLIGEELKRFGIDRPRVWIHGELDWLAEMGAVTLLKPGSVVVATLTEKGARHLRRALVIEGVNRPSRPGE
jgi:repressor of nif and glnA expression